jgi:hypothetical protein
VQFVRRPPELTFQPRRGKDFIGPADASVCNHDITALRWGVRLCLLEHVDLLVPVSGVAFDKLDIPLNREQGNFDGRRKHTAQAPSLCSTPSPR